MDVRAVNPRHRGAMASDVMRAHVKPEVREKLRSGGRRMVKEGIELDEHQCDRPLVSSYFFLSHPLPPRSRQPLSSSSCWQIVARCGSAS